MRKLKFYQSRLNKNFLILFGAVFFILSCTKEKLDNDEISVTIIKKEKLDENSLLITLLFKNKSNKNYAYSTFPEYYLVSNKGKNSDVDIGDNGGTMNIRGKIISSDFADEIERWEKGNKLLFSFCKKTLFDYKNSDSDFSNFLSNSDDSFSSYILFLPKKSERKMIICFNSFKVNHKTFYDKNTRVAANWKFFEPRAKILDSLLKKKKINYQVYWKSPLLINSLLINK